MRPINPLGHPDWDAQLVHRPGFSFFHGTAWSKVLVETYGYTPLFLAADNSFLPLMEVASRLTGRRGIALPFTDECAPPGADRPIFGNLFQAALALGRERGWRSVECRGGANLLDDATASLSFYGHALDLGADENARWKRLEVSARRAVRKAEGEGVRVEILTSEAAVRDFYCLQCLTRRRHGLPPQPLPFFLNIQKHILSQNQGFVAVADAGGKKIAAAVFFHLGGRAVYKYGASDFAWQHLRPNQLVMWTAMQWLARQGATQLDLGKTSLANAGLRRFKLNLGAAERKIEYMKFDLRHGRFVTETDGVSGWHNRVFRRLPLPLARLAGRLLYKHWA